MGVGWSGLPKRVGRAGWAVRGLAAGVCLSLTTIAAIAVAPAAHAAPACSSAVPDSASAVRVAKACGRRVEDVSRRSETGQVFANPDGSSTVERSVRPRFAKTPGGTWVDVDPTLAVNGDGSVSPRAATFPMVLSGGGPGPLVRASRSGRTLALSWPGVLPKPVLAGSTATYPDVLPGVDLRVEVGADWFSHVLVVKTRASAANPALRTVSFGLSAPGLTVVATTTGGVEARDPAGGVVFSAPAPLMWDTPGGPVAGSAGQRRQRQMPVAVRDGVVAVMPDVGMLADPATVFPVVIDPSWTGGKAGNGWTTVWSRSDVAGTSFWQNSTAMSNGAQLGDAGAGLTCDSSDDQGNCLSPTYTMRSLFAMDLSAVTGKHILSATFSISQKWAWTCNNGGSSAKLWLTGTISPATTWNNQPSWDGGRTATAPGNHRVDSAFGCSGAGPVEFDVGSWVTYVLSGGWSMMTVGLRAGDEGTTAQWKRFDDSTAKLSVTYNSVPNTPDTLTIDGRACGTGTGKAYVSTVGGHNPQLKARVSDADAADHLDATFNWTSSAGTPPTAVGPAVAVHDGYTSVFTVNTGTGHLQETYFTAGQPWQSQDLSAIVGTPAAAGTPATVVHGAFTSVFTVNAGNGHVQETWFTWGQPWHTQDLSGALGAPAAGGVPVGVVHDSGYMSVFTVDAGNGHLREMWQPPTGGTWYTQDLTTAVGGPAAVGSPGAVVHGGFMSVFTVNAGTGHVQETWFTWGQPWHTQDLSGALGAPTATGTPAAAVHDGGYTSAFTIDAGNGHLREMWQPPTGGTWNTQDLSLASTTKTGFRPNITNGQTAQVDTDASTFTPGVIYTWSASASDGIDRSATGGPCEFTVDNSAPNTAPTVVSTDYPVDGTMHDGVGKAGTFTFGSNGNSDAGVNDVVSYLYGTTEAPVTPVNATGMGGGATIQFTPTHVGINDLYVRSVDRAGNLGPVTDYRFLVGRGTPPVGAWSLAEGTGTLAHDSGSGHHDATLHGGASWTAGRLVGDKALHLNGTDADATTAGPVLDTSRSYTVAAWVRLPSRGGTCCYNVLGQDGATNTAFFLRYDGSTDQWVFTVVATDGTTGWVDVHAPGGPAGVWTHVAGVYDASTRQARLYVNGALQATATVSTTFNATGPFVIGRARWAGANGSRWPGDIADVQVWDRVIYDDEVASLAAPVQVGRWKLDDLAGTSAADSSQNHRHPGTLSGGVQFTGTGHNTDDSGSATFAGTDGAITTAGPVLDTSQSYTVAAWAKLPSRGGTCCYNLLSQDANTNTPFFLRYDGNTDQWVFTIVAADGTTGWVDVHGPGGPAGVWIHIAGVYDATAKQARLYLNGQLAATAAVPTTFNATGPLTIGRARWAAANSGYWRGDVDEVRAYQGALSDQAIATLANS
jgi:hypothetical protein